MILVCSSGISSEQRHIYVWHELRNADPSDRSPLNSGGFAGRAFRMFFGNSV